MKALATLAVALFLGSCGATLDVCSNPPAGNLNVFFAGGDPSRDVSATVAAITPLEELGGFRYDMRDGARLTWIHPEPLAGVEVGRTYRFVVDYSAGFPDASGIVIYDRDQFVFAAHSDQKAFQHVLKDGIPGLTIASGEPVCTSRSGTKCHEALVNLPLRVTTNGAEAVTLHQGERKTVGGFEVHALASQKVTYRDRCADAGVPGVAFTIRRVN